MFLTVVLEVHSPILEPYSSLVEDMQGTAQHIHPELFGQRDVQDRVLSQHA
jgi:hypothetical protein